MVSHMSLSKTASVFVEYSGTNDSAVLPVIVFIKLC